MGLDAGIYAQFQPKQLTMADMIQQQEGIKHLNAQTQAVNLQNLATQRDQQNTQSLADIYRQSVGPDGTLDTSKLYGGMAQQGLGAQIPGAQKINLANQEQQVKINVEQLKQVKAHSDLVSEALGGLLVSRHGQPIGKQDVFAVIQNAVSQGKLSPQEASHYIDSIPNDPDLTPWARGAAIQAEQFKAHLDQFLGKGQEVDLGGSKQMYAFNPASGTIQPIGPSQAKTPTPGEFLTAQSAHEGHQVTLRGQNMVDARMREKNTQDAVPGGDAQAYAQAILEGRASWPKGRDMTDPMKREALRIAIQADPTLNESTHAQRQQTQKAFTTGKQADSANALNTAMGHASELSDLADALGNSTGITPLNYLKNGVKGQLNDTDITAFNTVKKALADEATKVWRGTGGSERDVQEAMSNLSPNLSKDQLQRNILEFTKLMGSKQAALESQYKKGMGGMKSITLLDDDAKAALAKIQGRNGIKTGAVPSTNLPKIGTIEDGHRYKGGDPGKPSSWEKVQ